MGYVRYFGHVGKRGYVGKRGCVACVGYEYCKPLKGDPFFDFLRYHFQSIFNGLRVTLIFEGSVGCVKYVGYKGCVG